MKWKDIEGYEDKYEISSTGLIRNKNRQNILKPTKASHGYLNVTFWKNHKRDTRLVHRLVAETFIGKVKLRDVNHIDGNKLNNNLNNIEYVTRSQNIKHAYDIGLNHKGENHGMSKLTSVDVCFIKHLLKIGEKNINIAKLFNVNPSLISYIKSDKIWRDIKW